MSSKGKWGRLEASAWITFIGIAFLFSAAIAVTLIAPNFIDPSWHQASSGYQIQMHEILDPNVYVSTSNPGGSGLQYVYHLKEGETLHAYQESEQVKIIAPPELQSFITHFKDPVLKLTSKVLFLGPAQNSLLAEEKQKELQMEWLATQSDANKEKLNVPRYQILELRDPQREEAFAITESDGIIENWAEKDFVVVGSNLPEIYKGFEGVIYIKNPKEYRFKHFSYLSKSYTVYDPDGTSAPNIEALKSGDAQFLSRKDLICKGEEIYRIEGCWYCHTDQTRTLVQDTVLNGSADFPAPPSSASEYVYQEVTFPGTRRIGPDLSRVGVKRPHRDWHMSHFWEPRTESVGSVMPSFRHFFDQDPSGSLPHTYGVPNYEFEAIFQYLMTKGTRITPPTQAWWLGKDPIQTLEIIDGGTHG